MPFTVKLNPTLGIIEVVYLGAIAWLSFPPPRDQFWMLYDFLKQPARIGAGWCRFFLSIKRPLIGS